MPEMAGSCRNCWILLEKAIKGLEMDGNGLNGWKWLEMPGNGWTWLERAGFGLKWMEWLE